MVASGAGAPARIDRGGDGLREYLDGIKSLVDVAVLASGHGTRSAMVVFLSQALVHHGLDASRLVKRWAPAMGGGGGGRPDFAQAGGRQGDSVDALLDLVRRDLQTELATVSV